MWLSQKIKKDPEAKKALKNISNLIREYSDATKITKPKFWSTDIGTVFRPKKITYFLAVIITIIVLPILFYITYIDIDGLHEILLLSLRISVPILVLGITLSNVIKNLDKESKFAKEYIHESCRTILFTCLAFLTVLAGLFAYITRPPDTVWFLPVFFCFFAIGVGGTVWCLMSQVYCVAEIIKCMAPEISTKMASNYFARQTIHAFLKKTYNDIWNNKHSELLKDELQSYKKVFHYNDSYIKSLSSNNDEKFQFNLPQIEKSRVGYRDFNLRKLKEIEKMLLKTDAELYLEPNLYKSRLYGTLYYKEENKELEKVKKLTFGKFRKDKHVNVNNEFWDDLHEKLFNTIRKVFEERDVTQFRQYMISIERVFNAIIQVRKNDLARKCSDLRLENFQFLRLYIRSLKWLLSPKKEEDEAVRDLFIKEITHSFDRQTESYIENGDWYILDAFKWVVPAMYKQFEQHKETSLWESRAKIGRFYYDVVYILSESQLRITKEERHQIQLTLHKGIISWLLVAIKNEDYSLLKDLCVSARRLIFPDNKIELKQSELVVQHLILCGKFLKLLSSEDTIIDAVTFKLLLFDEFDHNREFCFEFNELIDFFIENRKNNPRDYFWEFSETDWQEASPLGGGAHGTPRHEFDGTELDYAFIYLALLNISKNEQARSIDFWHYSIKENINILKNSAEKINFNRFEGQREIFEKWLDECNELYEKQEEQKVAEAELKPENITVFKDSFWGGYQERNTFLKYCIERNYYVIEDSLSTTGRFKLPKTLFLEDANRCVHTGTSTGQNIARNEDNYLIYKIIESSLENHVDAANNIEDAFNKSSRWLIENGLREIEGVIVYFGNEYIEGELRENEYFVPSWKLENEKYFSGYYRNFPIIKIHRRGDSQHCIALELKDWKGIRLRNDILTIQKYGDLNVRPRSEEEVTEAIQKDPNLNENDRNKAKGICVAEYELYWQLNKANLPTQFCISVRLEGK